MYLRTIVTESIVFFFLFVFSLFFYQERKNSWSTSKKRVFWGVLGIITILFLRSAYLDLMYYRSISYQKKGDFQKAIFINKKIMNSVGISYFLNRFVLFNTGIVCYFNKSYKQAERYLKKNLEEDRWVEVKDVAYDFLIKTYLALGNKEEARNLFLWKKAVLNILKFDEKTGRVLE